MSDQQNKHKSANLDELSDELTRGLKLCHSLIDDYRSKLASSLNDNEEASAANDDADVGNHRATAPEGRN